MNIIQDYILYIFLLLIVGYIFFKTIKKEGFAPGIPGLGDFDFEKFAKDAVNKALKPIKEDLLDEVRGVAEDAIEPVKKPIEDAVEEVSNLDKYLKDLENYINDILDQIKDFVNEIKDFIVEKIQEAIDTILNELEKLGDLMESFINSIEDKITGFLDSIKNMFVALGEIIYEGIVQPILYFFSGFSTIFLEIFDILMKIVNKIISLPSCMPSYMLSAMYDISNAIYKLFVPEFLQYFFKMIYQYIVYPLLIAAYYVFIYPIELLLNLFGSSLVEPIQKWYKDNKKKCFDFNLKQQILNMGRTFTKIGTEFAEDFGRLDFSKLNTF